MVVEILLGFCVMILAVNSWLLWVMYNVDTKKSWPKVGDKTMKAVDPNEKKFTAKVYTERRDK